MTSAQRTDVGTIEDLHASATRATGLEDFGDTDYLEPLGILLDSYRSEAGLTELGSKMFRFFLKGALVARLLSERRGRRTRNTPTSRSPGRSS